MAIKELAIFNFRNHEKLNLHLTNGITVFTGPNGSGKTSILEAISVLASSRSFRSGKNEDFILHHRDFAKISALVENQGLQNTISLDLQGKSKKVLLNEKNVRRVRSVLKLLPFVIFAPGDHKIIDGDASDRRNFLNRAASCLDFDYADVLTDYNRILLQRNQLLKRNSSEPNGWHRTQEQIAVWDTQILASGMKLMILRNQYLNALQDKLSMEYKQISGKNDLFFAEYLPLGKEEKIELSDLEKKYHQELKDSLRRDHSNGTTNTGPHKDEIVLTLNGNKAKFYGSQGEKRTGVLALRLGEVALFREKFKKSPVLLLDDISSELDSSRRHSLVELLRQEDAQVLITATELPADLMKDLERPYVHCDLGRLKEGHA
jgi:DNA replication and repair protein RecF